MTNSNGNDDSVEESRRPLRNVDMAGCNRMKCAGEDRRGHWFSPTGR